MIKSLIKKAGLWAILFFAADLTFVFLTWLLSPQYLKAVSLFIVLFTGLTVGIGCFAEHRSRQKRIKAIQSFLDEPGEAAKQRLLSVTDAPWHPVINALYEQLSNQSAAINKKQLDLQNYRDYIEAWTHEMKTPLSLATLVLDNHKEEMSPYVYSRMSHIRHQIGEDVDRILYYARLQADHADYNFTRLRLDECVQEVVSDFYLLAEEKHVAFQLDLLLSEVVSDQRILSFMLSQLISNAVKYAAPEDGIVQISVWQAKDARKEIHLAVRDNGAGVPPQDAPFIFDKGFTGSHPDRQKATGMGLYLVKKYAEALAIEVRLEPVTAACGGFGIELIFPEVRNQSD